ncbi:MAG: hypothetical protein QXV17_10335 [Candidatus Micrarchaeaceae archaeon]
MRSIFFTEKGKVVVDTEKDDLIYDAPTETADFRGLTSGKDLYVHTTKKGDIVFYFHVWSRYESVPDRNELATKDEAMKYIAEQTQRGGVFMPSENEIQKFLKYVPDFLEENA